jgi:hypothetical protein
MRHDLAGQQHLNRVPVEETGVYEVIYNGKVNRCGFAILKIAEDQRLPISTAQYPLRLHPHNAIATNRFSRGIREKCEERGAEIKLR